MVEDTSRSSVGAEETRRGDDELQVIDCEDGKRAKVPSLNYTEKVDR